MGLHCNQLIFDSPCPAPQQQEYHQQRGGRCGRGDRRGGQPGRGGRRSTNAAPKPDKSCSQCFRCDVYGHYARECPSPEGTGKGDQYDIRESRMPPPTVSFDRVQKPKSKQECITRDASSATRVGPRAPNAPGVGKLTRPPIAIFIAHVSTTSRVVHLCSSILAYIGFKSVYIRYRV